MKKIQIFVLLIINLILISACNPFKQGEKDEKTNKIIAHSQKDQNESQVAAKDQEEKDEDYSEIEANMFLKDGLFGNVFTCGGDRVYSSGFEMKFE